MSKEQRRLLEMTAGQTAVINGRFVLLTKDGSFKIGSSQLSLPEAVRELQKGISEI